jgi:CHAD domain-containing protein
MGMVTQVESTHEGPQPAPDDLPQDVTYYDTSDLRLARAGIALCRRSDGWHAMLPATDRGEQLVPLSRSDGEVPTELVDLVRAHTGGRSLTACTDSAADTPARVPSTPTLDENSSGGAVVTAYLRAQVVELRAADVAVRLDEPDGVHDLRVAVRRLRSCLRVFGGIVDRDRTRPLAAELKWLSDVLGDARDVEVIRDALTQAIDATPSELVLGPVRAEVDRHLARREADTGAALRDALAGRRYLDLLDTLDAVLADPPYRDKAHRRAVRVLPPLARKAYRKARRAADAVGQAERGPQRDDALHRVRKSVKRLRYAAETVEPVVGAPAARYRRQCKKVQGTLGDQHDLVVLRAVLRDLGGQAHLDGGNGFTFGLLHGRAGERAIREEHRFPERWRRLARGKARRWMRVSPAGNG